MWVPQEIKDPVLIQAPTRKSVACFGVVRPQTGKFVRSICQKFNAVTFEAFPKKLLRQRCAARACWSCWTTPDITMPPCWRRCGASTDES